MTDLKPVFIWQPSRFEQSKNGKVDYVGKFRTKVKEGTPGAFRVQGKNEAGKEWDFWAKAVDSVNGVVRWVDVRSGEYGATIELFLETEKALHQVSSKFDVRNLRAVMNHLCGLKKELPTAHINIGYWVRKDTDENGKVKTYKDDSPIYAKDLVFRDVPKLHEKWRAFASENGLDWVKEKRGLDDVWNYDAEIAYWLEMIVRIQRFLLQTDKVLPFCWNSVTACNAPSLGGNLTEEEIAACTNIYESVKGLYRFPFSREETSADSILDEETSAQPDVPAFSTFKEEIERQNPALSNAFPMEVPANFAEGDDLPF